MLVPRGAAGLSASWMIERICSAMSSKSVSYTHLDVYKRQVRDVTASAEIGKTYLGKVVRLAEFGAFVELFPGTDGLLHISEISEHRIRDVRDELKLGDQVLVKVLSIEGNKVRLSRKALIKEAREKQQKAVGAASGATGGDGGSAQHGQQSGSEQETADGHDGAPIGNPDSGE